MKASELRIGNYLQGREVVKVKSIYKDDKVKIEGNTSTFFIGENPCLEPIPLTEEWLLKFGFETYIGWDDMTFWCLPDRFDKEDRFELLETLKGYELPNGKICEYVHQLQSCFYFHYLTGEELKIK